MKILNRIRRKVIALFLLVCFVYQLVFPSIALALTGGPSQPEVESFSPIGATDMVDLFSGDFSYNIPLLDVGGYPVNLIYNSNPSSDQEASWVGLGWNINPGSITRNMRGLPDDFNGDVVEKNYNIKENKSWGVDLGISPKLVGIKIPKNLNFNLGLSANNYKGYGISTGVSATLSSSKGGSGSMTGSLGVQFSSQDGVSLSAQANMENANRQNTLENSIGLGYNTRSGLKDLTFSSSTQIGGVSISAFATPSFTPTISMPMHNNSFTLNGTVGGEVFGLHGNLTVSGFWSKQSLESKTRNAKSFGYLNSSQGSKNQSALMDFNREKDITYTKEIPVLPIPNYTYDMFNVSGQGLSGQFRPHRGDIGILFDGAATSGSESTQGGIQIGAGGIFHGGGNINQVTVTTTSKKWNTGNSLVPNVDFSDSGNDLYFEDDYFKKSGEMVKKDEAFYASIGNNDPILNSIVSVNNQPRFSRYNLASNVEISPITVGQKVIRTHRDKRGEIFTFLDGAEASAAGLDKFISTFVINSLPYEANCALSGRGGWKERINQYTFERSIHPSHHISEIKITKQDGKKYVYGIPAYNNYHYDVTFACKDTVVDPISGLISYTPNVDDTQANSHGLDNYFSSEKIPAYAYAYLLTGILSPDYQDRTGNGISNDDIGEAIRFNYSRVNSEYQWRIPYQENRASINTGLKAGNGAFNSSVGGDAKGSYSFGNKELWYVHSIESKTLLAMFYLADREDALGVKGKHGGHNSTPTDSERQKMLKEIKLFSKSDLLKYGSKAVPVKTIHFVYDYSLCPSVPNNSGVSIDNSDNGISYYTDATNVNASKGKLTLKQVYFTYGNNTKGQLSSYNFNYQNFNPVYGLKNYDRWGNYKNNSASGMIASNAEFPYTLQDTALTNNFIRAYNLESIELPSGGKISVQLESDDYAYVQDHRAGQMYFVSSFGRFSQTNPNQFIDDGSNLYYGAEANDIMVLNVGNNAGDVVNKYLIGIDEIAYRFCIDIGSTSQYDFISGYVKLNKVGNWYGKIDSDKIWVKIKKAKNSYNPISHYSWQFLRNYLPEIAHPGSSDPGNNLGDAILGLIGSFSDIVTMITGASNHAVKKNWAKRFMPIKSWVRLNNSNFHKLGGGSRVKKITITDNWSLMAPSGVTKEYGQEYFYSDTTNGKNISTGVAIWEPAIGQEENPLRKPVWYEVKRPLMENDNHFMEAPFGESFFPQASVGYSQVIVANTSNEQVRRTATGYTVNQYYTAKEFPIITSHTKVESKKHKPPFKITFLGSSASKEKWLVSQGMYVEFNDMHGKQKASKVFNAMGHEISSTYTYYKTEKFNGKNRISCSADVIKQDGSIIQNANIGEDIDFFMDMREQTTKTKGAGADINVDGFIIPLGFIPLFLVLPPVIPKLTVEEVQFRSSVGMKVAHRSGILDRVVATKDGSTIETKNLCYDAETGEVLLTRTQNEFNEPIFNWTYPSHWAYSNMGPAYTNVGVVLKNVQVVNGEIFNLTNAMDYLNEGDKVLALLSDQTPYKVLTVGQHATSGLCLLDDKYYATIKNVNDQIISCDLKVIESGKRNMAPTSIGNLMTLHKPPIDSTNLNSLKFAYNSNVKVLESSIQEYNDTWKVDCKDLKNRHCEVERPNFCIDDFINLIITYNRNHSPSIFETCSNQISVGDLYKMCNCHCIPDSINGQDVDDMLFTKVKCGVPSPPLVTSRGWKFGDCLLLMNSLSGNSISLDSLQIIEPIGQDSSWTKVYVGANHTDSVSFSIECWDCNDTCDPITLNDSMVINPYLSGMLNNWHPSKSWKYLVNRVPTSGLLEKRSSGPYASYSPFWNYNQSTKLWENSGPNTDDKWVNTNSITRINRAGIEIENKNVLDNYSAALYGYRQSMAIAVASNSKFKEIANDNFEDYSYQTSCVGPCAADHWNFSQSLISNHVFVTDTFSHTGRYSLFVDAGNSTTVNRDILYIGEDSLFTRSLDTGAFYMYNGCLDKFSPDSGTYILSGWVRELQDCGEYGYINDSIKVSFSGSSQIYVFTPSGVVVDGWQRYESVFVVPSAASEINVTLYGGLVGAFFDDLRIHPYHANMKSFVYDPRSLKLMAELDENNYATFYEYDDQGNLVRVKKETERGIMTLKETRSSYKRQ
ncbi:MAG TPA: hypothetical protein PKM16_08520 [Bacteroidia bacterium]|nr:hypothetical protein [Bacteroidia bacterium]HNS11695.1 hypothetical protein [Bacteroidia bacterium]